MKALFLTTLLICTPFILNAASRLILNPAQNYQARIFDDGKVIFTNLVTGAENTVETNVQPDDGYFQGSEFILVAGDKLVSIVPNITLRDSSGRPTSPQSYTGVIRQDDGRLVTRPLSPLGRN